MKLHIGNVFGFSVFEDDSLPPDQWRIEYPVVARDAVERMRQAQERIEELEAENKLLREIIYPPIGGGAYTGGR